MNKKILLICPDFYDYKEKIEAELCERGYEVFSFNERPRRWVYTFVKRLLPKRLMHFFYDFYFLYYLGILENNYDEFLCIRGEVVSIKFLEKLRESNPNINSILYQWDSVNVTNFTRIMKYFDKVKTFDFEDSERFGLEYIPLFYGEEYYFDNLNNDLIYDLVYVGSFNNERYAVINEIKKCCESIGLKYYFHLYISFPDYVKLKFFSNLNVKKEDVKFNILTREDVVELNSKSRCVLDVENIKQTGFTMRTFETLATGRMLITTNKNINKLVDFKEQYFFMDRDNISLPDDVSSFSPKKSKAISSYSLKNWLERILS